MRAAGAVPPGTETVAEHVIDGRSERRERNRQAVVDAAVALVQEGWLDPPVEEVTKRSGLSQRSIFRYFDGLDDLRRAVMHRTLELAAPQLAFDTAPHGDLAERVARFTAYRTRLFAALYRPARLARAREVFNPVTAEELGRFRALMHSQVRAIFAPELAKLAPDARDDTAILVSATTSFDEWDLLTRVWGRTPEQVAAAWERILLVLFDT